MQKTDLFARTGGTGIAANPNVLKAAFSDTVLVQNNNSDPIELAPNHIVVVRVAEHKPATPKADRRGARSGAREASIAERTAKKAKARADELFARSARGESLDRDRRARTSSRSKRSRTSAATRSNVDSAIVGAAFALPRPRRTNRRRSSSRWRTTRTRCCSSTSVTDGDPSKLDAKTKEAARNTLADGIGDDRDARVRRCAARRRESARFRR